MSPAAKYLVGIDLGTTNTSVSYVRLGEDEQGQVHDFPIPQLVRLGQVEPRPTLPSFLLLTKPGELPPGALDLPWPGHSIAGDAGFSAGLAVGTLARDHGAKLPHRLVSSAKSWLVAAGADRRAAFLPTSGQATAPGAPADTGGEKVSPVQALARYLGHILRAWNHDRAQEGADARLEVQDVVLTVPASFDPVARELTVEAAEMAGFSRDRLTLLEEPTAAMYAWLASLGPGWRSAVNVGDLLLVCDVGGGTSDFSLILVKDRQGDLELERVAVGEHILLGGDNMDIMLAHVVQQRMADQGVQLDAWQSRELWHACRAGKEALLDSDAPESVPVVVQGRGSRLIGGQLKADLWRDDAQFAVESFFPECGPGELPRRSVAGLRQVGLPYAQDPAVTKHLAAFLTRHATTVGDSDFAKPTAILFNGGVFQSSVVRDRLTRVVSGWLESAGAHAAKQLEHDHLDLAVSRGAAYYGWTRRGHGIRIRGGTAQAFYIGIESALPAIPGLPIPIHGLCVAPMGMEEGSQTPVGESIFHLTVGEPARFDFLASSTRREDAAGALLSSADTAALTPVSTLEVELPTGDGKAGASSSAVAVQLRAQVTETGTLEVWCHAQDGSGRWKLEHDLRAGQP